MQVQTECDPDYINFGEENDELSYLEGKSESR